MFARALTHESFAARRVCSPVAKQMGNEKFCRISSQDAFYVPPCSYSNWQSGTGVLLFFFFRPSRFLGGKNWETQSWCGFISKQMEMQGM
jgi:hypothetical protein